MSSLWTGEGMLLGMAAQDVSARALRAVLGRCLLGRT